MIREVEDICDENNFEVLQYKNNPCITIKHHFTIIITFFERKNTRCI
jgi:hypothetical protein